MADRYVCAHCGGPCSMMGHWMESEQRWRCDPVDPTPIDTDAYDGREPYPTEPLWPASAGDNPR